MQTPPLVFKARKTDGDLGAVLPSRAAALARVIVRMAAEGAEGNLHETLLAVQPSSARKALEETVCLYLFIAHRSATAFLQEDVFPPYHRDAFLASTWEETVALLAAGLEDPEARRELREGFEELWNTRRMQYAACSRMYRQENESLEGTVIFDFYRRAVGLGREPALHMLANLQVPLLHVELSKALAELICEALGIEL
ncbi:MAG TPA: hypothetical protein VMS56_05470 [Thermoanaerobaculia bacterium]|nr:hypothetical protein [Thermoanaerobaculia bacterium]